MLCVAGSLLLTGCKKPGVVEEKPEAPSPQTELPVPERLPPQGEAPSAPPPVRKVMDEEVKSRWKAVEITVEEKKEEGGQSFTVEIPLVHLTVEMTVTSTFLISWGLLTSYWEVLTASSIACAGSILMPMELLIVKIIVLQIKISNRKTMIQMV